jgi:fructosamine-3-kinase
MWQSIAKQITDCMNAPFNIDKRQLVLHTEDSNYYQISDHKQRGSYIVRITPKSLSTKFDMTTRNLSLMADWLISPNIILYGSTADQCFSVFESFDVEESPPLPNEWNSLGKRFAKMHLECQQGMYGWEEDTFIYQQIQPNRWQKNWASFFSEQRIGWQLQLHQEKGKHLFNISDITSVIHRLLHHHHPEPCLLHGQLLPDNILVTNAGLFLPDNACYCGDRELDLAWLTTFSPNYDDFMQGYTETWPLSQGYEARQVIYALYPLLVQLHQDPALETRIHHHIALILAI